MTWFAVGIAGAGLLLTYTGQRAAGRAEEERGRHLAQLGEFEAQQLEANALTEFAYAQRVAMEEGRRARIAESRALALAAASGGGASDPTVVRIIAELAGEGAYRSAIALYEGEERASQMLLGAQARRMEGQFGLEAGASARSAYNLMAGGSLLTGAGKIGITLYDKYGTPPTPQTTNQPAIVGGTNQDAGITGLGGYA